MRIRFTGGVVITPTMVKLLGNITEISRAGLYEDHRERVTVSVEGAEPLYAELRLPNKEGWNVGQRLLIVIVRADSDDVNLIASSPPADRGSD
jgi:hypothetical protein